MARGRYKNAPPSVLAQLAWDKYADKAPQMISNYQKAINRVINDPNASQRYITGVAVWTQVMRSESVRVAIMNAIAQAKAQYRNMRAGATASVTVPATVPMTR